MTDRKAIRYLKPIALCVAVALAANAVFLLVRLADWAIPRETIGERIREAFADGSLGLFSYPPGVMSGADQYTDCVSMQIAVIGNTTMWTNALAPRIVSPENVTPGQAARKINRNVELKVFLDGDIREETMDTYTRFWHGQSTLFGLASLFLPIEGYRALLLMLTLALIAASAVAAALQGPRLLWSLAPLFLISFLLGGQTHYGQLLSYGPAQVVCWAIVLFLIVRHERLSFVPWLMIATLAGALEAFSDMMISVPLVAAIFLVVSGTLLAKRWTSLREAAGWMVSLTVAWSFGFVATYAAKLALTCAALGWRAVLGPFLTQLKFRVSLSDPEMGMPEDATWFDMIFENIDLLTKRVWHLGYTNRQTEFASELFVWLALAGWLYALWRFAMAARKGRSSASLMAGAGYLAGSAFVLAWVAAFPEHTWRHSWIMVRMTVIWVAAGWGWALAERALQRLDGLGRSDRS